MLVLSINNNQQITLTNNLSQILTNVIEFVERHMVVTSEAMVASQITVQ